MSEKSRNGPWLRRQRPESIQRVHIRDNLKRTSRVVGIPLEEALSAEFHQALADGGETAADIEGVFVMFLCDVCGVPVLRGDRLHCMAEDDDEPWKLCEECHDVLS